MIIAAESSRTTKSPVPVSGALLLELEGAVRPLRKTLFEAASSWLASQSIELQQAQFMRCAGCIPATAAQLAENLPGEIDADALGRAMFDAVKQGVASGAIRLPEGLVKLLDAAAGRGLALAALSGLPDALAREIFAASGLEARGAKLFLFAEEDKVFPRADSWLKVSKQIHQSPRNCIAVGSSQNACKTALSAGMPAIAVPDEFTSFHDFSGADFVIESWDASDPASLLEILAPVEI
ncbi:MAG: hypothetical protein NZ740_02925 [Kiritimatiellae bacterium]|nr:hypothetical protein [Kiritimatiellia bacterium]MDW8458046.1 hypothetical protein [Verrucomicrobiota bacterium]